MKTFGLPYYKIENLANEMAQKKINRPTFDDPKVKRLFDILLRVKKARVEYVEASDQRKATDQFGKELFYCIKKVISLFKRNMLREEDKLGLSVRLFTYFEDSYLLTNKFISFQEKVPIRYKLERIIVLDDLMHIIFTLLNLKKNILENKQNLNLSDYFKHMFRLNQFRDSTFSQIQLPKKNLKLSKRIQKRSAQIKKEITTEFWNYLGKIDKSLIITMKVFNEIERDKENIHYQNTTILARYIIACSNSLSNPQFRQSCSVLLKYIEDNFDSLLLAKESLKEFFCNVINYPEINQHPVYIGLEENLSKINEQVENKKWMSFVNQCVQQTAELKGVEDACYEQSASFLTHQKLLKYTCNELSELSNGVQSSHQDLVDTQNSIMALKEKFKNLSVETSDKLNEIKKAKQSEVRKRKKLKKRHKKQINSEKELEDAKVKSIQIKRHDLEELKKQKAKVLKERDMLIANREKGIDNSLKEIIANNKRTQGEISRLKKENISYKELNKDLELKLNVLQKERQALLQEQQAVKDKEEKMLTQIKALNSIEKDWCNVMELISRTQEQLSLIKMSKKKLDSRILEIESLEIDNTRLTLKNTTTKEKMLNIQNRINTQKMEYIKKHPFEVVSITPQGKLETENVYEVVFKAPEQICVMIGQSLRGELWLSDEYLKAFRYNIDQLVEFNLSKYMSCVFNVFAKVQNAQNIKIFFSGSLELFKGIFPICNTLLKDGVFLKILPLMANYISEINIKAKYNNFGNEIYLAMVFAFLAKYVLANLDAEHAFNSLLKTFYGQFKGDLNNARGQCKKFEHKLKNTYYYHLKHIKTPFQTINQTHKKNRY